MRKEMKKQKANVRSKRGITLIALVVTIVVLLILAGITISTLFGDNGIISAARKAAEDTEKVERDTQNQLGNLANEMNNVFNSEEKKEPTDQKYFTYTLDESTKTAKITGIKEEYGLKSYYKGVTSEYDIITAIKTEDGKYITDVVIPSKIVQGEKEYIVTEIGAEAFGNYNKGWWINNYTIEKEFTSFNIPSTVTKIGDYAFCGCKGLPNIIIPSSVTSIGSNAFCYCSGLTSITIPGSVTNIGSNAFYECRSLTDITIPNSVTIIGSNAFSYCSGLTSITIQNGVKNIEMGAFSSCTSLTNITIPSSVVTMGREVFWNIPSITVTVPFTSGNKPSGWDSKWNSTNGYTVTVNYQP